jgi:hypothetical protein
MALDFCIPSLDRYIRFGSEADIDRQPRYISFGPIADM